MEPEFNVTFDSVRVVDLETGEAVDPNTVPHVVAIAEDAVDQAVTKAGGTVIEFPHQ